ncbi:MAG: sulfate adenylyltransferase, partial [Candidatus Aminicenantes bacterium]|nr:sulfate adenylyltransferase [Candidatus Aminicenantes bacterium]
MIRPHGGKLVERSLKPDQKKAALDNSKGWPKIRLNAESVSDVENIAWGVYSPLEGFLGEKEFLGVLNHSRLTNDLPWSIPIVLDLGAEEAKALKPGQDILLTDEAGRPLAAFRLEEKYGYDKETMAARVFGTTDPQHP